MLKLTHQTLAVVGLVGTIASAATTLGTSGVEAAQRYAVPIYRSPVYRAPVYRPPVYRAPVRVPVYRVPAIRPSVRVQNPRRNVMVKVPAVQRQINRKPPVKIAVPRVKARPARVANATALRPSITGRPVKNAAVSVPKKNPTVPAARTSTKNSNNHAPANITPNSVPVAIPTGGVGQKQCVTCIPGQTYILNGDVEKGREYIFTGKPNCSATGQESCWKLAPTTQPGPLRVSPTYDAKFGKLIENNTLQPHCMFVARARRDCYVLDSTGMLFDSLTKQDYEWNPTVIRKKYKVKEIDAVTARRYINDKMIEDARAKPAPNGDQEAPKAWVCDDPQNPTAPKYTTNDSTKCANFATEKTFWRSSTEYPNPYTNKGEVPAEVLRKLTPETSVDEYIDMYNAMRKLDWPKATDKAQPFEQDHSKVKHEPGGPASSGMSGRPECRTFRAHPIKCEGNDSACKIWLSQMQQRCM